MKLENRAQVAASPTEVFGLLTDVERVVGCLPGATLSGHEEVDGVDAYRGGVRVKVGPIAMTYEGTVRFVEVDKDALVMQLLGQAADAKGGGDAEAMVRVAVLEAPAGSEIQITTDLVLTGKVVAFGKNAIVMVADRLLQQFADNLGRLIAQPAEATVAGGGVPPRQTAFASAPDVTEQSSDSLDLGTLVGPGTKVVMVAVAAFVAGMMQGWLISRAFGRRDR